MKSLSKAILTMFMVIVLSFLSLGPAFGGILDNVGSTGGNSGGGYTGGGGGSSSGGSNSSGGGGGTGGTGSGSGLSQAVRTESGSGFYPSRPPASLRPAISILPGSNVSIPRWNGGSGWRSDINGFSCAGSTPYGNYIGWTWRVSYIVETLTAQGAVGESGVTSITSANYTCIEPPNFTESQVWCAWQIGARITGPYRNPRVSAEVLLDRTVNARFVSTRSVRDCDNYTFRNFDVKDPVEYGRYLSVARGYQVACTLRNYTTRDKRTGSVPATEIRNCNTSRTRLYSRNTVRAQLFCPRPGFALNWGGNHTYTAEECLTGDPGRWNCGPTVNRTPTFAGRKADPVQVLDDGEVRKVRWGILNPRNVRNITDKYTRLQFLEGTPYRRDAAGNGLAPNSSRQPFVTSPKLNSWTSGWRGTASGSTGTTFDVRFFEAGETGEPWRARPQWSFSGSVPATAVRIESFDWQTGTMNYSTYTTRLRVEDVKCTGQPMSANVFRARNSSS